MRILAPLLIALLPLGTAQAQDPPPDRDWHTIHTEHFRVTFHPGLESVARHTAERAEHVWHELAENLTRPPGGRIDIVVTDHVDLTNGFARTLPSNRVVIHTNPPTTTQGLDHFGDWIDLVVTHELVHIFHLDRTSAVGRIARSIFGRVPVLWPVFPVHETPLWSVEGLATDIESAYTGFGRVEGTFHEMIVRAAILENRFDPFDRVSASSPIWPAGQRPYIYGSLFMDYLAGQHGEDVRDRVVDATAGAILPPFLFFGNVGTRAFGTSFAHAYRNWRDALERRYTRLADSLRAAGLTSGERLTRHGRTALHARFSPSGDRIAYVADDGRSDLAMRILDANTGATLASWRRNSVGAFAWVPDGRGLLISQIERDGPYHAWEDLYRMGHDGERRLTHGARLLDPDLTRDGGRIVAVENGGGSNRLVTMDPVSGVRAPLTAVEPDVHWAWPRWSPDGTRIAASRWHAGHYDIVVIDTLGAVVHELTNERAVATGATWSTDGRWVLFASDRTGITNLYAADMMRGGRLRQITNVLGGAFFPDVSPDGRFIVYSAYASDGYHIERMPFDPTRWRVPSPVVRTPALHDGDGDDVRVVQMTETSYSAWRTLRPWHWEPLFSDEGAAGTFFGVRTLGHDVVGRHRWLLETMLDPGAGRTKINASWIFAGLGNPVLELAVFRDWDSLGRVELPDATVRDVIARDEAAALFVTVLHPRWRWNARLSFGVQLERNARTILAAPDSIRLADPADDQASFIARAAFANYRVHPFSVSREDGISLSVGARVTREKDPHPLLPGDYEEVTGSLAAYRRLPLPGFAHHVLALRSSTRLRFGDGARPFGIGGASGTIVDVIGLDIGGNNLFLPVRGFDPAVRAGTRAWSGSAEYRVPVALVGRNIPLTPLFLDRLSAGLFGDVGDASCPDAIAQTYAACTRIAADTDSGPLYSTGAELLADLRISEWFAARVRGGIALPVRGPGSSPVFFLRFGSSF